MAHGAWKVLLRTTDEDRLEEVMGLLDDAGIRFRERYTQAGSRGDLEAITLYVKASNLPRARRIAAEVA